MPTNPIVDSAALDAYTQELATKINTKINSKLVNIYIIKGSAIYADAAYIASPTKVSPDIDSVGIWQQVDGNWTKITNYRAGWTYNITNDFTTDAIFVEGAGIEAKAGINITVINTGTEEVPNYRLDLMSASGSIDPALLAVKQNKVLTNEPDVVVPDLTYATAAARLAATTSTVSDGMIAYQEDTEEYYYADVFQGVLTWYDIGNTKTVEDAIILISSVMPSKPIPIADIRALFA